MKRPIAMLLALLLTAGLFAFVSCGDGKNYTVKEVEDGYGRMEKRIFLKQKELDRIEEELAEKGYSITRLKGFEESDYWGFAVNPAGFGSPTVQSLVKIASIAAKCHLVKPYEIFRIDFVTPIGYRVVFYMTVHTMKIDELFYTDGNEKAGDIVTLMSTNSSGKDYIADEYEEDGIRLKKAETSDLGADGAFYILTTRDSSSYGDEELYRKIYGELADFYWMGYPYLEISVMGENVYEISSSWEGLLEGAERINGSLWKIENFDRRFQKLVEEYKSE